MADIPYIQQAQEVKITGQDSGGTTVNYVTADSNGNLAVKDASDGTAGSAIPSVTTQVGGSDGTNLRTISTDSSGKIKVNINDSSGNAFSTSNPFNVSQIDGQKQTYSAAINGLATATTATDIFTITGSGTKTIRINRIEFSATQTTGASIAILLVKRSTANSGGTSATQTAVPHDSSNSSATATVRSYTANPTSLGTAVGNVRTLRTLIPATSAGTTQSAPVGWAFGDRPGQAIVLRGTGEVFSFNLNSTTLVGGTFDISIEWTEE